MIYSLFIIIPALAYALMQWNAGGNGDVFAIIPLALAWVIPVSLWMLLIKKRAIIPRWLGLLLTLLVIILTLLFFLFCMFVSVSFGDNLFYIIS